MPVVGVAQSARSAPIAESHSHVFLWLSVIVGVGLSLFISIAAALNRNADLTRAPIEAPPIPPSAAQVDELKREVFRLKQTVDLQRTEIMRLRTDVLSAESMLRESRSPTPVGHGGPNLIDNKIK